MFIKSDNINAALVTKKYTFDYLYTLKKPNMSVAKKDYKRITTKSLIEMKANGEKIAMLTAYDYTMAKIVDTAGIDVILVGDSASNVMAGHETTLPITLDQMIYHASSVVRAIERALVVVDLPFGSYQSDPKEALRSSIRIMKESGGHAVKLEGGKEIKDSIKKILNAGIPVMGHLGLTPQSIYKFGTYTVRAKEDEEAEKLMEDAKLLENLGCFALVLEKIPAHLAERVAKSISIPVIGIGAGGGVDGQVLVIHDMLGMNNEFSPRFLRRYMDLYNGMTTAIGQYVTDVKSSDFPNSNEQY
jgi:3-methyl-2-oxobutanoate hydroxymethyltransferase